MFMSFHRHSNDRLVFFKEYFNKRSVYCFRWIGSFHTAVIMLSNLIN